MRAAVTAKWSCLGAALLCAACTGQDGAAGKGLPPPAAPVTVATAVQRDVPVQLRAIGTVQAFATVAIVSQVSGEVMTVHFQEGATVRAGEVLFTIDPRPFQAALRQAQATLEQHEAAVAQAQANLNRDRAQLLNARAQEQRYRQLLASQTVAREQYDQMLAEANALEAAVTAARAAITTARAQVKADQAMLDNAMLQLSYTTIRAPIDGRTGSVLVHAGNVARASEADHPLVVLSGIQPIYVAFHLPERELARVQAERAAHPLAVTATVPGRSGPPPRGTLTFIDSTVDPSTGTIPLKATFANEDEALWPGQFVDVDLTLRTLPGAVLVPSQAIQTGQQGTYVFVVQADRTVVLRPVVLGDPVARDVVVTQGLTAGDRVVTDGQLRLFPGAQVDIAAPATAMPPGARQ